MNDLRSLMTFVYNRWLFKREKYPVLGKLDWEDGRAFVIKHVLLHQIKTCGQVAQALDVIDHDRGAERTPDLAVLKKASRNFLINALQFANLCDMSAVDLQSALEEWGKQEHVP